MFNDFEMEQKEKAFNYSKLRFQNMDKFLNDGYGKLRDEAPNYSLIFITIAKFISFKEDIWIKNKQTKDISTNFSRNILDDYLFRGKLKSTKIGFQFETKRNKYNFTPIKIFNILSGKEHDSVWIIDNIRDSIAHGHYYIDFTDNKIVIKNQHPDRLLECSLKFDLFFGLNELITEERIGGYTEKALITPPIIHLIWDNSKPMIKSIKSEYELNNLLKNNFVISYSKVSNCLEKDEERKYEDLLNFFNFNSRLMEEMFKKIRGNSNKAHFYKDVYSDYYIKKVSSYIKDNLNNCHVTIFSDHLNQNNINKVIAYLREQNKFYERNIDEQALILQQILKSVLSHEEITIERGITDFVESYTCSSLKQNITDANLIYHLDNLIFSNVNSFKENKKLANLHILALNNFVSNKETIYDKHFEDYVEFNLDNFTYQDYSGYNRLITKLKKLNNELNITNNSLTKTLENQKKLNDNLSKIPENKKQILLDNINNGNLLISKLNNKIYNLLIEIKNIEKEINNAQKDDIGYYINSNNKSFFNHLRNAFAHNHIKYEDDRLVYNRKIILEDIDDKGELSFRCVCRYYDLVKLFNHELFLESLTKNKIHTKTRNI